jgi:hypothetical protein
MVSEILREDLVRQKKYKIEFINCKTSELKSKTDSVNPDIIISTAPVKPEWLKEWEEADIHFFKGTPFLTGIGDAPLIEQMIKLLDGWDVKKK